MKILKNPPAQDVLKFCEECDVLGYKNNNSLKAMKFEWCTDTGGAWWGAYDGDAIVSMAGIHPFEDGYRTMFRGAQTTSAIAGLSKTHMTSIPWRYIMPEQIAWAQSNNPDAPLYITTNISNDASGKMNRTHRLFKLLEKQGIVDYVRDDEIFYTMQSVWKLNIGPYYKTLQEANNGNTNT